MCSLRKTTQSRSEDVIVVVVVVRNDLIEMSVISNFIMTCSFFNEVRGGLFIFPSSLSVTIQTTAMRHTHTRTHSYIQNGYLPGHKPTFLHTKYVSACLCILAT